VVGIDLGTTNSVIAYWDRDRPRVYKPYHDSFLLPSVVFRELDGGWVVGRVAQRNRALHPSRVFRSLKRHMWDPEFRATVDGVEYTPAQLSAQILKKLQEIAQTAVPTSHIVRAAVSVPYGFKHFERSQTLQAAQYANLCPQDATHLINEPTAAALAYGLDRSLAEKPETVLVFDLGGGTFDITIFQVYQEAQTLVVEVLGVGGDPELGGDDFDGKLMEQFAERIKQAAGLDVLDLAKDQGVSVQKLRAAQQTLKELAERAKIELSEAASVTVHEPSIIHDEAGREYGLTDEKITREEFLQATHDLLLATRQPVEEALKEAGLGVEDIDRIILAGGSTRMAGVKEMVREMFGKEPWSDIDPTTLVARGAALYGAGGILEQNRTSHFLGVELLNQRFGKLIEKNAPLPAQTAKVYQTVEVDPEAIRIAVFQSPEAIDYTTDRAATCLGEFFLVIPEDKRQKAFRNVRVGMEMTPENLLKIRAELEDEAGVCEAVEIRKEGERDGRNDTNPD